MKQKLRDKKLKMVLVGDANTGKTLLWSSYLGQSIPSNYTPTIGVELGKKDVTLGQLDIELKLWDLTGLERFRSVIFSYLKSSDGVMLVYDAGSRESFDHLETWLSGIKRASSTQPCALLVANHRDGQEKVVDSSEAEAFAQVHGMVFIEVDAMQNRDVNMAFQQLLKFTLIAEINRTGSLVQSLNTLKNDPEKLNDFIVALKLATDSVGRSLKRLVGQTTIDSAIAQFQAHVKVNPYEAALNFIRSTDARGAHSRGWKLAQLLSRVCNPPFNPELLQMFEDNLVTMQACTATGASSSRLLAGPSALFAERRDSAGSELMIEAPLLKGAQS